MSHHKRNARSLATAGALIAVALASASAQAQNVADDVQCQGGPCVHDSDIVGGAVTSGKIRNLEVKTPDLAFDSVTSPKILDGQVKTPDLAAGAVTTGKLAVGAVRSGRIANGAVTLSKLAASVSLSQGRTEIVDCGEISQQGSYVLVNDLPGPGGFHNGGCLDITADDVTLDLNGFKVIGGLSSTNDGIIMDGRSNIEIRNGTVRDFFGDGISDDSDTPGEDNRMIDLRVLDNGADGIFLPGDGIQVRNCLVQSNRASGIEVGDDSVVADSTASNNGTGGPVNTRHGIVAGLGATVTGNIATGSNGNGILVDDGSIVAGNTASTNSLAGILAQSGSTVTGNTVSANRGGNGGITVGAGSTVTGNTAKDHPNTIGIFVSDHCTLTGNTATSNGLDGIHAGNGCTVIGNSASNNGLSSAIASKDGIDVGAGSTVTGNTAYLNQGYGIELRGGNSFVDSNTAYLNNQSGGFSNLSTCATCTVIDNHAP